MRRDQMLLLLLFALVLLSGCTGRDPTGVAFWFCVISFGVAVICGFIAVRIKDDSTRIASGIICVIFLVVSLGILG